MNHGHEIGLPAGGVIHHSIELGNGAKRPQDRGLELGRHPLERAKIHCSVSKHEVKVERCDRRAVHGGNCVADENHFEMRAVDGGEECREQRRGIHDGRLRRKRVNGSTSHLSRGSDAIAAMRFAVGVRLESSER